jgi:FixJ family two-component response regulator
MRGISSKGIVFIVDDDEGVRDSLQWLLSGKGFDARAYESAEEFLLRYDRKEMACLLVDIRMPGMSGLELQEHLMKIGSPLPVAIITGHGDVPMAVDTMKKGALDFIQKPFNEQDLTDSVHRLIDRARTTFVEYELDIVRNNLLNTLTKREREVLNRIVAGRLNKQIADDLNISIKTVEAHRANVMEKLKAQTVADLLKIALGKSEITD